MTDHVDAAMVGPWTFHQHEVKYQSKMCGFKNESFSTVALSLLYISIAEPICWQLDKSCQSFSVCLAVAKDLYENIKRH